ncbi:hypothetical protein E2562_003101 [Oryza meyeriana var. granulata]|uniref:Uncharacterized protein n=1 Tax=Oryza meyeriana var. granulata TaxID=110450 RepID=A0A6G1E996_9ORYZ|nr:hypothetical protein E2562_003101 [Oryza meyeriana var. granulata]
MSSDKSAYSSTTGVPSPWGHHRFSKGGRDVRGPVPVGESLSRAISAHVLRKSQNAVPSESVWF